MKAQAVTVAALLWILTPGCGVFTAPGYQGPSSDHFDGEIFQNQDGQHQGTFWGFLKWRFTRDLGPWRDWVDDAPGPAPPAQVTDGDLRITFINHATLLIQMDGLNILTDPMWSERCSPVAWAGPKRHRDPGIRFEDLPPIHVVLVSHNHYDHLDVASLQRLSQEHQPRILAGLGNLAYLQEIEVERGEDLDWWQETSVSDDVKVTFVPARHFSGRGTSDRNRTLWGGFVVQGPSGAVYFAGDTGMGPHFEEIGERFGPLRLMLLPIGAYRPVDFMAPVHISPAEAVQVHQSLGAPITVGMHFGTFELADDGELEPVEDLKKSLGAAGLSDERFWILGHGEGRDVPALTSDAPEDG